MPDAHGHFLRASNSRLHALAFNLQLLLVSARSLVLTCAACWQMSASANKCLGARTAHGVRNLFVHPCRPWLLHAEHVEEPTCKCTLENAP